MPFFFFDSTMLLLVPCGILALYAQYKARKAYKEFSRVTSAAGLSGAETAQRILQQHNLYDVGIEEYPARSPTTTTRATRWGGCPRISITVTTWLAWP